MSSWLRLLLLMAVAAFVAPVHLPGLAAHVAAARQADDRGAPTLGDLDDGSDDLGDTDEQGDADDAVDDVPAALAVTASVVSITPAARGVVCVPGRSSPWNARAASSSVFRPPRTS